MASVTSLDKDLRNLRLSRYTPQAAAEVREWIEETLQERLPAGDLLDALKDGVALCRLVNLAVSPGVKYKQSSMPFVQMENISHFLRACQMAPLNLPPHDVFLTVDLYESKDPAQVLQCLLAFSRRANALQPNKFPRAIGVQSKGGALSPHLTGSSQSATTPRKSRGLSNVSDRSGTSSPAKSPAAVSSWSKKSDQHATMPAWNIHQYGYMGGASQGNQGVAFGARRQITTPSPLVPSLEEKERRRREQEELQRTEREDAERLRQQEREVEEAHAKAEEERRWEEETARMKEVERRRLDEERQQWDEQQREWAEEERKRQQAEKEVEEKLNNDRQRRREGGDVRLTGQFLSQYQAGLSDETRESQRIKQLEQELERAKERERQYEQERQEVQKSQPPKPESRSPRPVPVPPKPSYDLSSLEQERRMLRTEWQKHQPHDETAESASSPPPMPPRPLPEPAQSAAAAAPPTPSRPLPDPAAYTTKSQAQDSRVNRFLASNQPPVAPTPATHRPQDYTTTSEVDEENTRRIAAQQKTRAGGWASKSLLEREMERERERQREWEESQKQTRDTAAKGLSDSKIGVGPGQGAWDVHQYGFIGGDNQNRGGPGLGVGGARRQIIGPRPPS